ncbi:AIPR family protein [Bacillus pseudomycoides]|uniref:AIPR family protein n=1 Tax=Bacillus pseudomycoides TaxID=64104 RepID=UPI00215ACBC0|nr:AIPR family protein [Bacillus pseudomycoides]MCR8861256.1 AIPR family protein [Bacillus pseudomycoides]
MSNQLILLNKVLEEFMKNGNFKDESKAFERFATEQYFKDQDIGIDEVENGLIGNSKDGGVDGLYLFINDEVVFDKDQIPDTKKISLDVYIIQYKNSSKIEELVLDRFHGSIPYIFDLSKKEEELNKVFHPELVEKILFFHEVWLEISTRHPEINVKFIHACKGDSTKTLGHKSTNISYISKMERLKELVLNLGGDNFTVDYQILDANWLLELNRKEKRYSLKLKLNENPIAIDYKDENQRGYIASVNIYEYFQFLCNEDKSLRKYLFESNIRDYQNGTIVNEEISKTVLEEKDIDFWWLNNGVTIIAENGTLSGKILHLDNIQIVNGLQTSQTIYNILKENDLKDDVRSLMLKIIITSDKKTNDAIIKATNSQNTVPAFSLRATDPIQREIEEFLLTKGYYYDRRKNFYKNEGKPRKSIISISYMSQCLTALIERNPSKARSNPTTLVKTESDYKKLFNPGRKLDIYYKVLKLMKTVEICLKEEFSPKNEIEVHISNNYKFHIGRIVTSYLLNKATYNDNDILNIDVENTEKIKDQTNVAIDSLNKIIQKYQKEIGKKDIVNISKTTSFSEYITKNIQEIVQAVKS